MKTTMMRFCHALSLQPFWVYYVFFRWSLNASTSSNIFPLVLSVLVPYFVFSWFTSVFPSGHPFLEPWYDFHRFCKYSVQYNYSIKKFIYTMEVGIPLKRNVEKDHLPIQNHWFCHIWTYFDWGYDPVACSCVGLLLQIPRNYPPVIPNFFRICPPFVDLPKKKKIPVGCRFVVVTIERPKRQRGS